MKKYNCPSCGAEIVFQSSDSVYAVCKYCTSMVVRRDVDVEAIGKMAQLVDDMTPFQLGTSGKYNNTTFTLIGRSRMSWSDGFWNEWFMYMDDGTRGWLAEAQGSLAISFEQQLSDNEKESVEKIIQQDSIGATINIGKKSFSVTDLKEAECVGSEGELPFEARKGRKAKYFDMTGSNGEFAGIEYADKKKRTYIGKYVEFDNLKFSYLRELDGWKQ